MEKYIFTFEDGTHYIGNKITETDVNSVEDGTLSIIRLSDGKQMVTVNTWVELTEWVSE